MRPTTISAVQNRKYLWEEDNIWNQTAGSMNRDILCDDTKRNECMSTHESRQGSMVGSPDGMLTMPVGGILSKDRLGTISRRVREICYRSGGLPSNRPRTFINLDGSVQERRDLMWNYRLALSLIVVSATDARRFRVQNEVGLGTEKV